MYRKNENKLEINNVEDILPITQLQKSMLYSYLIDQDSYKYFEQWRYKIKGSIDVKLMIEAWDYVIQNNELLRCVFRWENLKEPVQIILKSKKADIRKYDLRRINEKQNTADKIALFEWKRRVNIQDDPIRIAFSIINDEEYEMIVTSHHIILDGWSNAIVIKELLNCYTTLYNGQALSLRKKGRIKQYLKYQRDINNINHFGYWESMLSNYQHKPIKEVPETAKQQYEYKADIKKIVLGESKSKDIAEFCREHSITVSVLMYVAWAILMTTYTGKYDVMFGITLSGRDVDVIGIEEMVGVFIKTLPLRLSLSNHQSIYDFLCKTQKLMFDIEAHKDIEYSDLLKILKDNLKLIMDTVIVMQNYPVDEQLLDTNASLKISLYSSFYEIESDITIGIKAFGRNIDIEVLYNRFAFSDEYMEQLCKRYYNIILQITDKKDLENCLVEDIIRKNVEIFIPICSTVDDIEELNNLEYSF
ncbi:MAG: condensation domain-containing protein [Bacillota bacterium]